MGFLFCILVPFGVIGCLKGIRGAGLKPTTLQPSGSQSDAMAMSHFNPNIRTP